MPKLTFLCFFLLLSPNLLAQSIKTWSCGMSQTDQELLAKRTLESKRTYEQGLTSSRTETTWVPVKFHLVSRTNGTGAISEIDVFENLCTLNDYYFDQDIQFYIGDGEFNYILNSNAYESGIGTAANLLFDQAKSEYPGMLHIFILNNYADGAVFNTDFGGFYSISDDHILLEIEFVRDDKYTIAHQVGHYFSLLHTHHGWTAFGYDIDKFGQQCPEILPGGLVAEKQAREGDCKNCDETGDFLCDTNPDYFFFKYYDHDNCEYLEDVLDPCGELVVPPTDNLMAYYGSCELSFTEEQKGLIEASLFNRRKTGSINPEFNPTEVEQITGEVTIISPLESEVLDHNDVVKLKWEEVTGASRYIIDVDIVSTFNVLPERYFSESPRITITDLNPDKDYYWKVFPYNETYTCHTWSDTFSFTSGDGLTNTSDLFSNKDWSIHPNPISFEKEITLIINSTKTIKAEFQIFDLLGKEMNNKTVTLIAGNNTIKMGLESLESGTYMISYKIDQKSSSKKLIVNK